MSTATAKEIVVRRLTQDELPALEQMYETFEPKEVALGLPPRDPSRRRDWLKHLSEGLNLVALMEGRIVGHTAVMPAGHAGELAVFVHQDYRRRGVAMAMARLAVEEARQQGLRSIWVLISSDNSPARAGLLNNGFHTAYESQGEVKLTYEL
jgi:L-amino acid N-acyltransferase YncA